MRKLKMLLLGTATTGVLMSGGTAYAQDSGAAAITDTITVTAQRREQSIQDVAATINAFGAEDLAEARFDDVEDVAMLVPNVDVKTALGGQNSVITIRGVGLNDFSSNNTGSAGVYVDEIFLSSVSALEFSMFDAARVEVLKGPQGTLYGRNATAGAINIISARPEFENSGYALVGAGDFGLLEAEGAVNIPFSENAAVRLSGRASTQESFFTDSATGGNLGDRETFGFRAQLALTGDTWDANLKVQTTTEDGPATPYNLVGAMTPQSAIDAQAVAAFLGFPPLAPILATDPAVGLLGVGSFCGAVAAGQPDPLTCADLTGFQDPTPGDVYDTTSNFAGGNATSIDADDITLNIQRDAGEGQLTFITGYRTVERSFGEDTDAQSLTLLEYNHFAEIEQLSQEIRYNWSNDETDLVAGVFWSNDEVTVRNNVLADDLFLTRLLISVDQETTTWAGFAHVEQTLSDTLTFNAGIRFTHEEKEYAGGTTDLNPFGISLLLQDPVTGAFFPDPLPLTFTNTSLEEDDISGRIGLDYRPSDNLLLYVSASRGFKSGGIIGDITFAAEELDPFEPEVVYAYEAGFRSDPADNFRMNGAIFYYDYQEVQTFVQGSLGPVMGNVPEATITGADLEFVWAATDRLDFSGAIGLLDTELGGTLYNGNRLPNAPDMSITAGFEYEAPLDGGRYINIQADAKYASDMERNAENDPLTTSDAYTAVNGRIAFGSMPNAWEVALWGQNLFEEEYTQQSYFLPTVGNIIQAYNAPRTWGVSLSRQF